MYSIYHIPTFVHKDGSIGKIGCTNQKPKTRVEKQGYSSFEILETYDCIDKASNREQELQKEYGYPIDYCPYNKTATMWKTAVKASKEMMSSDYGDRLRKKAQLSNKKNNSKVILQYSKEGIFIKEWVGIKATARALKTGAGNISGCLNGRLKTCGGFIWKYKE